PRACDVDQLLHEGAARRDGDEDQNVLAEEPPASPPYRSSGDRLGQGAEPDQPPFGQVREEACGGAHRRAAQGAPPERDDAHDDQDEVGADAPEGRAVEKARLQYVGGEAKEDDRPSPHGASSEAGGLPALSSSPRQATSPS